MQGLINTGSLHIDNGVVKSAAQLRAEGKDPFNYPPAPLEDAQTPYQFKVPVEVDKPPMGQPVATPDPRVPSGSPSPTGQPPRPMPAGQPPMPAGQPPRPMLAEQGQPTGPGVDWKGMLMQLGAGLDSMTLRPNENLQKLAQSNLEQKQAEKQSNRTIAWLRSQGRDDLAALVSQMPQYAGEAVNLALAKADLPEAYRNLMLRAQSAGLVEGSPEFKKFMLNGGADKSPLVQIGDINSTTGAGREGAEKFYVERFGALINQGDNAFRANQSLAQIEAINTETPEGFEAGLKSFAGRFGIETDGIDNIQTMEAVINRLVPAQRPAGSGSMSDSDLALFKRSLPQLMQTATGRQQVINTIKQINQYDMELAKIANLWMQSKIGVDEAHRRMASLANPLSWLGDSTDGGSGSGGSGTVYEVEY